MSTRRFLVLVLSVSVAGGACVAPALAQQVYPPTTAPSYPQTTPYQTPYGQQVPYGSAPYGSPTPDMTAKNPFLLAYVVGPVLQQAGAGLASGIGALFGRLFHALFGSSSAIAPNAQAMAGQFPPGMPYGVAPGTPSAYGQQVPTYGQQVPTYGQQVPTYGQQVPTYGQPSTPAYGQASGTGYPSPYGGAVASYPSAGVSPPSAYPAAGAGTVATQLPAGAYGVPPGIAGAATTSAPTTPVPSPYAIAPAGATAGGGVVQPAMAGAQYPGYPPNSAAPNGTLVPGTQAKAALVPSVIYTIDRLDPSTYQSTGQVDLGHGAPTLKTGDVFAIAYSTNVSGQVRIDNIDATGHVTALGTYTVLSGHDNRIPVKKGIQLTGAAGNETFKMYFFPCTASDAAGRADPAAQGADLPACGSAPSPKLLDASSGAIAAKGAINLDSPDPTIAVSAVTNYQALDVTENDFQITHVAR